MFQAGADKPERSLFAAWSKSLFRCRRGNVQEENLESTPLYDAKDGFQEKLFRCFSCSYEQRH